MEISVTDPPEWETRTYEGMISNVEIDHEKGNVIVSVVVDNGEKNRMWYNIPEKLHTKGYLGRLLIERFQIVKPGTNFTLEDLPDHLEGKDVLVDVIAPTDRDPINKDGEIIQPRYPEFENDTLRPKPKDD